MYQLSLEANPWQCDCRLRSLKSWLLRTRTPLSAPIKCAPIAPLAAGNEEQDGEQARRTARSLDANQAGKQLASERSDNLTPAGAGAQTGGRSSRAPVTSDQVYLDQLALDADFVCAPRANLQAPLTVTDLSSTQGSGPELEAPWLGGWGSNEGAETSSALGQGEAAKALASRLAAHVEGGQLDAIRLAFDYLEPTLVRRRRRQAKGAASAELKSGRGERAPTRAGQRGGRERRERLLAHEGKLAPP